jgi:phage repressor protein C with HTH and peptisase S24 domain
METPVIYSMASDLKTEYVQIPYYDVQASMGGGAFVERERVVDYFAFKSRWVRHVMGMDPKHSALINAVGDSMEPTLREGDLILVDLRQCQVHDDAVYVLRLDDRLMAKRLQRNFDGAVFIMSDNPVYEKLIVPKTSVADLHIIGRAVWVGRKI